MLPAVALAIVMLFSFAAALAWRWSHTATDSADPTHSRRVPGAHEVAWRYIVIHHSATEGGSAAEFARVQQRDRHWDELGYHFVIGNGKGCPDGKVEVGSRWPAQKWGAHCGGTPNNEYNNVGIGICLVGDFRRRMPTPQQLESLRQLTTFLARRYQIPPGRILGHGQAPGAATECPGDKLQEYVCTTLRDEIANDQPE